MSHQMGYFLNRTRVEAAVTFTETLPRAVQILARLLFPAIIRRRNKSPPTIIYPYAWPPLTVIVYELIRERTPLACVRPCYEERANSFLVFL